MDADTIRYLNFGLDRQAIAEHINLRNRQGRVELFTSRATPFCPFSHAARVVIAEKQISCDRIEIDRTGPSNAPPWYVTEISRSGEVPALRHNGTVVCEFVPLLEYLDSAFDGPQLMPTASAEIERVKLALRKSLTTLSAISKLLHCANGFASDEEARCKRELSADLAGWEHELRVSFNTRKNAECPFICGSIVTLADIVLHAVLQRLVLVGTYNGFELAPGMERLREFIKRFNERPSAKSELLDPIALIRSYEKHCRPAPIDCIAHIPDAVETAITEILGAVRELQSLMAGVKQQTAGSAWDLARGRAAILKRTTQAGASGMGDEVHGGLDLAALAQAAKSSVGTIGGVELAKEVGHR
jgi:glutathione S-transferase